MGFLEEVVNDRYSVDLKIKVNGGVVFNAELPEDVYKSMNLKVGESIPDDKAQVDKNYFLTALRGRKVWTILWSSVKGGGVGPSKIV